MAENATDDVLIVGVQRDCDCLCLGENKTKKHKRLAKAQQGKEQRKGTVERSSDNKSLAESCEVEVTCTEDLAASTKPNSEQSTQSEKTVKIPSTTNMMHQQPMADSASAAYPQRGATPNDCAHAKLAPTTTLNGGHEGTNSYGLGPAQQAGASVSTSHPGPKDDDLDWIDLSTSEWDTFLNQPLTADMNPTLANQHPNSSTRMIPRGNSADTTSSTALYDSSASTSDTTSHQALGAATPRRPQHSGADFANIIADTTEKDSAIQSARRNNLFSSTDYPASSNAMPSSSPPSTANENKNLNLSLFDTPSTAQSNCSTTPNHFVNRSIPTSATCNSSPPQAPQLQQQQQPVNAFRDQQQQQGYSSTTTFMAANRPPNYQAAPVQFGSSSGVQGQRQQQDYPAVVNKTFPNSQQLQSPVNFNNSAFFHSSPNGHAHPAMPPPPPPQATTQSGINAQQQQLLFNPGARPSAGAAGVGAISAPSNSQMQFVPNNSHLLAGGVQQQQQVPSFTPGSHSLPGLASSSVSGGGAGTTGTEHLQNDEVLARKLQEDEYIKGMIRSRHDDEKLAMSLLAKDLSIRQARNSVPPNIAQYPLLQQQPQQRQAQFPPQPAVQATAGGGPSNVSINASEQPTGAVLSNADEVLGTEQGPGGSMMKHPTCWTQCPNCPSEVMRKYHLIDVERGSPEWNVVSQPLFNSGFCVEQVQRIQNETLWQRLCFEKQLMLRDRPSCNEKFLYHTSKAKVAVICEEGLDPRLSRNGLFGSGIYFSDNPIKCDKYWSNRLDLERTMFCCRVLLGDTKVYPKGKSEQLKREPPKENPQPGEPKTYDSVKGNLSGQDEFVVYNAYRVMPEYVIKYNSSSESKATPLPFTMRPRSCMRRRSLLLHRINHQLPYSNPHSHSAVHPFAPPTCLQQPGVPPPVPPFIGGPSNNYYNLMPVPDSARFSAASPVAVPQLYYGMQPPMVQSPIPMPHFPRST